MINAQKVIPILQKSMPQATPQELTAAIQKFEKAHPTINDIQFLALMQKYIQSRQPPQTQPQQPPFSGLMGQLGAK